MTARGLFSVHLRYRRSLTDSWGARDEESPKLLRGVTELKPYQALSSDITYIHMKKELVMETIRATANS